MTFRERLDAFIANAIEEDIGDGDHSSLACIPGSSKGKAHLLAKEKGIISGVDIARYIFKKFDPDARVDIQINDGAHVKPGDKVFEIEAKVLDILKLERLVLNIMQRMSGIATKTAAYSELIKDLPTKILDTRKTYPNARFLEKEAVRIGGGTNHRFGLFDMVMLKDNHIDFSGGIGPAIEKVQRYLQETKKQLKIEIETRSIQEVKEVLSHGGVDRIMLDNFSVEQTKEAVRLIKGQVETESSGNINLQTIRQYAKCGVDYVSVGALTHHIQSLDLSLKAVV